MPKRTNVFQKLIAKIYMQMSAPDDRVEESAIVKERGNGTEREVDILLKKDIFGGITICIAVECRGRTDKDDITWVDGLIGKYRDLPIDKVVAVSKSGFSKSAIEKARANRIDTLTLVEALETNWPNEFKKLGIAKVFRHDKPHSIQVIPDEKLENPISTSMPLFTDQGEQIGTLEEVARFLYEQNKDNITKEIGKHLQSFFKTLDDLNKNQVVVGVPVTFTQPTYIGDGNKRIMVKQVIFEILCSFSYEIANPSHYILGNRQITQATIHDDQSQVDITITAIQGVNKPNQANVNVEKVNVSAKKSGNKGSK